MGDTFMSFFGVLKRVRELSRLFGSNGVRSTSSVERERLETSSFKNLVLDKENLSRTNAICADGFNEVVDDDSSPVMFFTPRLGPVSELDNTAALTIQKCYKSYRTRRNLADCAVVVEELW
ncbi:hypothetical protein Tco_0935380 [Tanacetum coccineum]